MKKKMVSMILATSMVFILLTGCGEYGNAGVADETESTEEKDASEEKITNVQEGTTEETVTETVDTAVEAKKYLVKTETMCKLTEDGKKKLVLHIDYEYDEKGNKVSSKHINADGLLSEVETDYDEYGNAVYSKSAFEGATDEEEKYYENELDGEGRILKRIILDGEKNPTGEVIECSYTGDRYESTKYINDFISSYEEGFVSDGTKYPTVMILYDVDHPKTEDEGSYDQKYVYEYEGTFKVAGEEYKADTGLYTTSHSEFEEMDEHNNPLVVRRYVKHYPDEMETEYIIEYTYLEME